MRCVYCHDNWTEGYRCECGAVYHNDCMQSECVTLGCVAESESKSIDFFGGAPTAFPYDDPWPLEPEKPSLWTRFWTWLDSSRVESNIEFNDTWDDPNWW